MPERRSRSCAGRGALDATDELEAVAERLGAPIIKALLGKAAVPDMSPYTTGGIGLLGTKPSQEALEQLRHPFDGRHIRSLTSSFCPSRARRAAFRSIWILRVSACVIRLRSVSSATAGCTLRALLPHLQRNENRSFLERRPRPERKNGGNLWKTGARRQERPMKPQVVAWELGKRLSDTAIVSSDSGTIATWFARQIPAKRGQMFSLSGTLATMANGLPYAIAAQIAYPERQCVAFVGDGGFSMLMAEFATAVKYQLPIKVIIIKNNTLGMIKWEQMVFLGNPEFGCELQPIDFVAFAKACGGTGMAIEDPVDCGRILDRALADPWARSLWKPSSTRLRRRCPLKSPSIRQRNLPNPSPAVNPTVRKSPGPCFQTKCGSSFRGAMRWPSLLGQRLRSA